MAAILKFLNNVIIISTNFPSNLDLIWQQISRIHRFLRIKTPFYKRPVPGCLKVKNFSAFLCTN